MAKYKINFMDIEINKFNLVENETIRKSCMSVYMYMLKLVQNNIEKHIEASLEDLSSNTLSISYRNFLKKYNIYHSKLTLPTLKSRLEILKKLKLIASEKVKNSFIYSFCRYMLNKKLNEKLNDLEQPQPVENASIEASTETCKYLNTKNNNKELESNSKLATSVVDNFDYKDYVEQEEKVSDWNYVDNLLQKAFKTLKVKSSWIKGTVVEKIYKYYTKITKKHAMAYICKSIQDVRNLYYSNYNKYVLNNNFSKCKVDNFTNYEQREYTLEDLEQIEDALSNASVERSYMGEDMLKEKLRNKKKMMISSSLRI